MAITHERKSLLSSASRVQAPWIKVTIGDYTFGVFDKKTRANAKDSKGFYTAYNVQYPNYVQRLSIVKINGQVNQYTLQLSYPVKASSDPNFFEKVFSSVANNRKIVFSYGDASMPNYVYKDEEAIITKVNQSFNFGNGGELGAVISYTVSAVSGAALAKSSSFTFINSKPRKPSDIIKEMWKNKVYGLQDIFTGMSTANLDYFIDGSDKVVELDSKTNISPLDYISYLVGCMVPAGSTNEQVGKDIYVLTIHDDSTYDTAFADSLSNNGPYFKVTRTSYAASHSDAFEIDIGYNTSTIVTDFSIEDNENYSIYYDYNNELYPEEYVRRLDDNGK